MNPPRASVCVVSWHRLEALKRCLTALGQLQYSGAFEIIVVADAGALAGVPSRLPVKRACVEVANISVARNLAIAQAAGEVVVFIDDDAVPEPTWLAELVAPFTDEGVSATGGYVRGRNGISWQWRGRRVNGWGETADHAQGDALPQGWAVKTEGTNMAVRRTALAALGGFDPAFAFYFDETDLNLRLAVRGYRTVLVPGAEVHHGFLASAYRRQDRAPLDLYEIGASWAVLLRKHAGTADYKARVAAARDEQRRRIDRYIVSGALEPRDMARLLATFDAGVADGAVRMVGTTADLTKSPEFLPYPAQQRPSSVLVCRPAELRRVAAQAHSKVQKGENVTVFVMSMTSSYHLIRYLADGVWYHFGGQYGKSERAQPLFKPWRLNERVHAEIQRVSRARNIANDVSLG